MLAQVYALITSIMFALNLVIMRRGLLNSSAYLGVFISLAIGSPFFLVLSLLTNEMIFNEIALTPLFLFILVGLFHFVIGRSLLYLSIDIIGSNISTPVVTLNHLYAALIGILLLGEQRTPIAYLGILLTAIGIIILGKFSSSVNYKKGFYLALVASIFYALTHVLIKLGLKACPTPIFGVFISYTSALIVYLLLYRKSLIKDLSNTNKEAMTCLVLAGIFVNLGQLFRYLALNIGDVSLVTPVFSTVPLFTLLFSFILNRRFEYFTLRIIFSSLIIVLGIILIQIA